MSLARLLLPLVLASTALAQTTPAEAPEWEGQYSDTKATMTLWARSEGAAGLLDVRGALYPVRAKVGRDGTITGTFQAGEQAFGFEGGIKEGVLRLKSGGVSLTLRKRPPAQGSAGVNPLAAPPAPEKGKAGAGPDLSHVHAGQTYVYVMQNNMKQVWTVNEVGADFVKYEIQMFMGGQPLGDSVEQEWRYTPPPPGQQAQAPARDDVKISREKVTISGIEFDCMVSEASGYKSWMTMSPGSDTVWTFPGVVRTIQLSDESIIIELGKIDD